MRRPGHDRDRRPEPEIIYEDGDILVVDKPAGMYVHPAPGHERGTLTDALLVRCPRLEGIGGPGRPGVVHRLDGDTSGVMVFAKTAAAYLALRREFESHRNVVKAYLAVLHGAPSPREGTLSRPIGRKPWDAKRMAVDVPGAKPAVTRWRTLGRQGPLALVEFRIETGRTHQIRVHAASLGHPIVGDPLYGDRLADRRLAVAPARTLLHAAELSFPHPRTGERVAFAAEVPADIVYAR